MEPLRENKLFDIRLFGAARSRAESQNLKFQITSLLSSRFGTRLPTAVLAYNRSFGPNDERDFKAVTHNSPPPMTLSSV
jgi:hypothetical protein